MRWVLTLMIFWAAGLSAQQPLDLGTAHRLAAESDPRVLQLRIEGEQSALRIENIETEERPSLALQGQAQYQSETVELPFTLPDGSSPGSPKDTYDASISAEQWIHDPSRAARIAEERARLAEARARVETSLYQLGQEVNEAFFTAALLQEREAQIATSIRDLEERLRQSRLRVETGVALPSEAATVEATLLQRREDLKDLRAQREAALVRLSKLTGRALGADDTLEIPELDDQYARARGSAGQIRERPELEQFARTIDRLEAQKSLTEAALRPRVSAYARAGYGRPGLDFLENDLHGYWLAGIRVQWKPWDWGRSEREQRIAELQQQEIQAEQEAFVRTLDRSVASDLATADRLADQSTSDDRIVALRELIERETRARFDEHVVTASEYVDKETDVLEARILRAIHRVQRAQAQARVLNLLGVEIQ